MCVQLATGVNCCSVVVTVNYTRYFSCTGKSDYFIGGAGTGLIDVSEEIKKLPEEAVFEIHAGQ
ncbi:hypothetical protein ACGL22_005005, partial [Escherichia coli]